MIIEYSPLFSSSPNNEINLKTYIETVYHRMVAFLIKDSKDRQWYSDDERLEEDDLKHYKDFLQTVKILSESNEVHIHTLNHDLLFEAFNTIGPLKGIISDGFSKSGSEYYGQCREKKPWQDVQLQRCIYEDAKAFDTQVKLIKLHGSLDYCWYNKENATTHREKVIKLEKDVESSSLFKMNNGTIKSRSPFEYVPIVLTGAKSKERQYGFPFYRDVTHMLCDDLRNSDLLVIIGYGFKDPCINCMMAECFSDTIKNIVIVSPDALTNLEISLFDQKRINACAGMNDLQLVPKEFNNINFFETIKRFL